ncbi:hypothetical protein ABT160_01255 [Streptomyces sp. NPDC001941]|uniref:hypothetical protein n=1 Tax=Streptomyces sp. NPDC001941 TaxID=3154659 RepID=UPI003324E7DB
MSDWSELASQAISALMGTLAGGAITILVARWQTARTIHAQAQLAASQQSATATLARSEWTQQRAAEAAQQLLERLATLYSWLPSLPDLDLDQPQFSIEARTKCGTAVESLRHGMQTELLSIPNDQVRFRYRTLVRLCYDVGYRRVGHENRARQIRDVRAYLRYVQLTLEAVIDAKPAPADCPPPALDRSDSESWVPPATPWYWQDPADNC